MFLDPFLFGFVFLLLPTGGVLVAVDVAVAVSTVAVICHGCGATNGGGCGYIPLNLPSISLCPCLWIWI